MEASAPEGGVSVGSEPPEFNQGQPQPSHEVTSSTGEREAPYHAAAPLPKPEEPRLGESQIPTQGPSHLVEVGPKVGPVEEFKQPRVPSQIPPAAESTIQTLPTTEVRLGSGANQNAIDAVEAEAERDRNLSVAQGGLERVTNFRGR